jgi:hypothetical protein
MSGGETLDVWGRAYHDLERRFEALATADGAVYLPNPEPTGPVDHLLVTMEPSLGGWARTREEAQAKVAAGFRNFVGYGGGDFGGGESDYLIYAVRRWLGSSYHVTDISKGAQLGADANRGREARWERWWPLLRDEFMLVGPRAHIWAVGGKVAHFLALHGVQTTPILHYSPVAARHRISAVVGREREFSDFKNAVSQEDLIATLAGPIGDVALRERCAARLAKRPLTESRLRLLFAYKQAFDGHPADVLSTDDSKPCASRESADSRTSRSARDGFG